MDYKKAIEIFNNWIIGKRYPLYNRATINKALNLSYDYLFIVEPINKDLHNINSLTNELNEIVK